MNARQLLVANLMLVVFSSASPAVSAPAVDADQRMEELGARLARLEARLDELEEALTPVMRKMQAEQHRGEMQAKARTRMRQDAQQHDRAKLRAAEELYQVANRNWRSAEAKAALKEMIDRFPDINRTGCAILYLGRMSDGQQRIDLLTRALDDHADCFYGDGTQVGPYAAFLLGQHHWQLDDPQAKEKAEALFAKLRERWPGAIDHRGQRLIDQLPKKSER